MPGTFIIHKQLFFLGLLAIAACRNQPGRFTTMNLGPFSVSAPADWKAYQEKGIDTYVGGLTNGKDTLSFDFGQFAGQIELDDVAGHVFGQGVINGLTAIIQRPQHGNKGAVRLNIARIGKDDYRFNLAGIMYMICKRSLRSLSPLQPEHDLEKGRAGYLYTIQGNHRKRS